MPKCRQRGGVGETTVRPERKLVGSGKRGDPRFMSQVSRMHLSGGILVRVREMFVHDKM